MGTRRLSIDRRLLFWQAEGWQERSGEAVSLRENHEEA